MKNKSNAKLLMIAFILTLVVIIGTTYAWLRLTKNSDVVNKITAGNLELILDDTTSEGIKLLKEIPRSYRQGMTTKEYTFTLTNKSSTSSYTLLLKDLDTYTNDEDQEVTIADEDRLADSKIRYILLKDGEEATASKSKILTDRVIDSGTIEKGKTIQYSLRIWIDSKAGDNNTEAEVMGKVFNAQLSLEATQTSTEQVDPDAEARIGKKYYKTLKEAVAAVPTDGTETTIETLKDIKLAEDKIEFPAGKNIILVNNYSIKSSSSATYASNVYGKVKFAGTGKYMQYTQSYDNADVTIAANMNQSFNAYGSSNVTVAKNGVVDHLNASSTTGNVVIDKGVVNNSVQAKKSLKISNATIGENIIFSGDNFIMTDSTVNSFVDLNSSPGTAEITNSTINVPYNPGIIFAGKTLTVTNSNVKSTSYTVQVNSSAASTVNIINSKLISTNSVSVYNSSGTRINISGSDTYIEARSAAVTSDYCYNGVIQASNLLITGGTIVNASGGPTLATSQGSYNSISGATLTPRVFCIDSNKVTG